MSVVSEMDDTARLILMDEPSGPMEFTVLMRATHPEATLTVLSHLWTKYRGMDGRLAPSHDYVTGVKL